MPALLVAHLCRYGKAAFAPSLGGGGAGTFPTSVSAVRVIFNAPTRPAFTLVCQRVVIAPPPRPVPADGPGLIWLGGDGVPGAPNGFMDFSDGCCSSLRSHKSDAMACYD